MNASGATSFPTEAGSPHPLGATPSSEGVNFSLFSANATSVQLLLFNGAEDPEPMQIISLDPFINKTFHFWHVLVRHLTPGVHYAFRVDGPHNPDAGQRFDPQKVLIDPYARGNNDTLLDRAAACVPGDNLKTSMRSVVIDTTVYEWEGNRPLGRPMNETIIYEIHVRGFTQSATSGVTHRGTFLGVIEKIPHLKELGITAVELLPVFDYDEKSTLREVNGRRLTNYWGYSPISFFAPQTSYCLTPEEGSHLREFRDMVKALHRAGIEVILDVVFNHTDEGNEKGPMFSFKGIDNRTYYYLVPGNQSYYFDYTGCGNTFNCNHPVAQKLIIESLRYWVEEMHVDGFRFDEGSILTLGEDGTPLVHPPIVWQVELDEPLSDTKLIAEAWDAAGIYQIGHFPGDRWAEWNGRYRDDIRRFVKGDPGVIGAVAARIAGSADIYQYRGQEPINSINFVTCHDGFTLQDLVSYNAKHNEANGENNRDGINDNLSWNCGAEGSTSDPGILALRMRQMKNFAALLMLSRGVPMVLGGDELGRTQQGDNNAYCHDNEISWFDWSLKDQNSELFRFWKLMIRFRKNHTTLFKNRFYGNEVNERGLPDVTWHGLKLNQPGWDDPNARALAFTLAGFRGEEDLHVILNMYWEPLDFEIPTNPGREWYKAVDTGEALPFDIREAGEEEPFPALICSVGGRSIIVLVSKQQEQS
jgi:glycogen operon protein